MTCRRNEFSVLAMQLRTTQLKNHAEDTAGRGNAMTQLKHNAPGEGYDATQA